jgi:hypothetical protein
VIEVRDMLSVLSVHGVERRMGALAGVERVTVDFAGAPSPRAMTKRNSLLPTPSRTYAKADTSLQANRTPSQ